MHVTVTGATGLVGSRLVERLLERGDRVTVLSRDGAKAADALGPGVEAVSWDPSAGSPDAAAPELVAALEGRDGVVNLAGQSVFGRWTDARKRAIHESRIGTTRRLVAGLGAARDAPGVLVSGSATGYYGDTGTRPVTEEQPAGDDFLAGLARDWEAEAANAAALGIRVVVVRTGMVLAAHGGALATMLPPFRFGLGTWLGSGKQAVPWIHLDDEVGLILAALDHGDFAGPVNAAAPGTVTNRDLSKAIGSALRRPVLVGAPAFAIRLGLGEAASLVLDSCAAVPGNAPDLDYAFAHPGLTGALDDLLG